MDLTLKILWVSLQTLAWSISDVTVYLWNAEFSVFYLQSPFFRICTGFLRQNHISSQNTLEKSYKFHDKRGGGKRVRFSVTSFMPLFKHLYRTIYEKVSCFSTKNISAEPIKVNDLELVFAPRKIIFKFSRPLLPPSKFKNRTVLGHFQAGKGPLNLPFRTLSPNGFHKKV